MQKTKMNLSWIVVSDFEKAKKYFTEVLGLELKQSNDKWGWAELKGSNGGSLLGIGQTNEHMELTPGSNAVVTISVDNVEKARANLLEKGTNLIGDIMEIPGHVKMQLFTDPDGNHFQLVEELASS